MKHCIIAKFGDMVADKKEAAAQVKALFAAAAPVEGVTGIVIHENCVARDNRYDLMIVVEMARGCAGRMGCVGDSSSVESAVWRQACIKSHLRLRGLRATKKLRQFVLPEFLR